MTKQSKLNEQEESLKKGPLGKNEEHDDKSSRDDKTKEKKKKKKEDTGIKGMSYMHPKDSNSL
ncbi:MAG: hypothetical protein M3Q97_07760 [Bacteroidota bacterium]|nr:hypothetical protein [Bacteroidota bacterium]